MFAGLQDLSYWQAAAIVALMVAIILVVAYLPHLILRERPAAGSTQSQKS